MSLINSLVVIYKGSRRTLVEDAASIATYGRRRAMLPLSDIETYTDARRIALAELARYKATRDEVNLSLEKGITPNTIPGVDFFVGDTVTAPDWAGTGTEQLKVKSITGSQTTDAGVDMSVDFLSRAETVDEHLVRAIRRMSPSNLTGRSYTVSPATTGDTDLRTGSVDFEEISLQRETGGVFTSGAFRVSETARLGLFDFTRMPPRTTNMGLQILVNGDPIDTSQNEHPPQDTMLVPANWAHIVSHCWGIVVGRMDTISFKITVGTSGPVSFQLFASYLK